MDAQPEDPAKPAPFKPLNKLQQWLRCSGQPEAVGGLPGRGKWVLFNVNMAGLYRVQYDHENWRLLTEALGDPKQRNNIGLVSRAQVSGD